ncbi:MAG: porin, partial [Sulfurimonas sp.]|nr:porin [Sulfurimonas sp.]
MQNKYIYLTLLAISSLAFFEYSNTQIEVKPSKTHQKLEIIEFSLVEHNLTTYRQKYMAYKDIVGKKYIVKSKPITITQITTIDEPTLKTIETKVEEEEVES